MKSIATPGVTLSQEDKGEFYRHYIRMGLGDSELKYLLMYFDKIYLLQGKPVCAAINTGQLELPVKAGLIEVVDVPNPYFLEGDEKISENLHNYRYIYDMLMSNTITDVIKKDPDCAVHSFGSSLLQATSKRKESLTANVQLLNCLPVPRSDTTIREVVEFKHKFDKDFHAFNKIMDSFYNEIANSNDCNFTANLYKNELKEAIEAITSITKEKVGISRFFDMKISLSLNAGIIGDLVSLNFGSLASRITISGEKSVTHKDVTANAMQYITNMHKSNII
ncbi:DUF6236 family protein [Vibrio lentus]